MTYLEMLIRFMLNYGYLYLSSLFCVFIIFWCWLTYVDRLHMREKCRMLGKKIKEYINKKVSDKNKILLQTYLFNQINALSECVAGFTNGIIHDEPIILVYEHKSKETQTTIETCSIDIQTDHIEPDIKEVEVIKEIIKEVPVYIKNTESHKTHEQYSQNNTDDIENLNSQDAFIINKIGPINHPTLEDDDKLDYTTMAQKPNKRVKIKIK